MIRVEFRKPDPPDAFDAWVVKCEAKVASMTCASDVSDALYKEQRAHILEVFRGKCAYCEAKIVLDQHHGDVEHFRPKGSVTDENDNTIEVPDGKGGKMPHPGYYWLAYNPSNLLPACIACNRPAKIGGRRVGKWERFPVQGAHAVKPAQVKKEKPLLLNPLDPADDPSDHLAFDPATGRIIGKTDRGRMCEKVFDLNREGLPEARRDVYDNVRARSTKLFDALMDDDAAKIDKELTFFLSHKDGAAEYSFASRAVVAKCVKHLKALEAKGG